ncbi:hypothetical protein KKG48_00170 [Patescibacteria group bacterium]|nr:hypothetical protein [Patescibacteria group bacterium]MCG2694693.1 hypothetical protein [Candidatus Parcubacteria bacterium]
MFRTRIHKIIDENALVKVFFGELEKDKKYYLDVLEGKVISEDKIKNFFDKKYKLIEPFEKTDIEKVMEDFIDNCGILILNDKDKIFAQKLIAIKNDENVLDKAVDILKTNEAWMLGWTEWRDTDFWPDIEDFILSADDKIKEVWDLDCSCAMCHMLGKELEKDKRVEVNWNFDNLKDNTEDN